MDATIDLGLGHLSVMLEDSPRRPPGAAYGPAAGLDALRAAIAAWEGVAGDEVIVTTGASMGLVCALATLERPCSVLCPRPHYPPYPRMAAMLGIEVVFYDLDEERDWLPSPAEMRSRLRPDTRALLLNVPGNPAGSIPGPDDMAEIARLAASRDLLVISDEVYADFIYDGRELPRMSELFDPGRLIRLKSFSKSFQMPGERLGYALGDPRLLARATQAHWTLAMSPPTSSQLLALRALEVDPAARIARLRDALRKNRDQAFAILGTSVRIQARIPAAGIFAWMKIEDLGVDSARLARLCLEEAQIIVFPGIAFGVNDPLFIRASFAVASPEVREGFTALVRYLDALPRTLRPG